MNWAACDSMKQHNKKAAPYENGEPHFYFYAIGYNGMLFGF